MARDVFITCAVTGGHNQYDKHPNFPITPSQIAESALEAAEAGAAIVHLHTRNPETGQHEYNPENYAKIVEEIKRHNGDVLINLSTGWGGHFVPDGTDPKTGGPGTTLMLPEPRMQHVLALKPDICTLDIGSFNYGQVTYVGHPPFSREMARLALEAGVKPEVEIFELGHLLQAATLYRDGMLTGPVLIQLCLGMPNAAPASGGVIDLMTSMMPDKAVWSAFSIGREAFPCAERAIARGGNVRVGLEDNLYLGPGEFASNGALVSRAAQLIEAAGCRLAGPAQAAEIIGLRTAAPLSA